MAGMAGRGGPRRRPTGARKFRLVAGGRAGCQRAESSRHGQSGPMPSDRSLADPLGVRADEKTTLTGTLDWYRAVIENKVTGLVEADARRVMTASGLTPLGVVKHLGWVERGWFRETFAGESLADLDQPDGDNGFEFVL